MNTALEQELQKRWPIRKDTIPSDKSTLEMFRRHFTEGAKWQAEQSKDQLYTKEDMWAAFVGEPSPFAKGTSQYKWLLGLFEKWLKERFK
jgi:hypothetical protein